MERMIFSCDKYNVEHITNIEQVRDFAKYLVSDLKVNVNPDTDFAEYIEYNTGKPTFNALEIERGNQLMTECCKVCESNFVDVYDVMLEILYAN